MLTPGTRLTVFSIRRVEHGGSIWARAGVAWVNKDSSLNVRLDVLPLDGMLHLRQAVAERREAPGVQPQREAPQPAVRSNEGSTSSSSHSDKAAINLAMAPVEGHT